LRVTSRYEAETSQKSIPPKTAPCHTAAPSPSILFLLLLPLSLFLGVGLGKEKKRGTQEEKERRVAGKGMPESKLDRGS